MNEDMSKVVFFNIKEWEIPHIESKLQDFDVKTCTDPLTLDNVSDYSDAQAISVFINSKLSADLLSKLPNLKLIATRSTGYDHIDTDYCKKNDITIANVPVYGARTVAEHTMALILALAKRLPESVDRVRKNEFYPEGLTGFDLHNKIIGVIGAGNIGANVVRYAKGFGMKILAYDAHQNSDLAKELGFEYVDLDTLISRSDIITLHLPYMEATHHILNRGNLSKVKKNVIIINTARGGLIETDALFDGLKSGQIGGAGLDVLEEEGFLKEELELLYKDTHTETDFKVALENHLMAHLPNVIITPHNAFNTHEALERIILKTIDNIIFSAQSSGDVAVVLS